MGYLNVSRDVGCHPDLSAGCQGLFNGEFGLLGGRC
jgi:hypothetical protein